MKPLYYVNPDHPLIWISCILMLMSAAVRILYFRNRPEPANRPTLAIHILLPLSCNFLFALLLPLYGKTALWTTAIPVVLGCLFFSLKSKTFSRKHKLLCRLLYLAVAALYTCTVTGLIPTARLLILLFGLPLLYHLFVEDLSIFRLSDPPLSLQDWLPEISVILIMASLLSASLAILKH
ncbi:MAG: hypothetical protein VB086_02585 [Clostridiaceae bacterium]|nr:hypothetical protein [Clostridiaceae bacterium]